MSATHSSLFTHARHCAGGILIVVATSVAVVDANGTGRCMDVPLRATVMSTVHAMRYTSTMSIPGTPPVRMTDRTTAEAKAGPDITAGDGIMIGGVAGSGGRFVRWGDTLVISKADAFLVNGAKYGFNVRYDVRNVGEIATAPAFTNRLRVGTVVFAQQTAIVLKGAETRRIDAQGYLPTGTYVLELALDDGNKVPETDETNNTFRVTVVFSP